MADKLKATLHGAERNIRIFMQVFSEEKRQDEGEFMTYGFVMRVGGGVEAQEFLEQAYTDMQNRLELIADGKSMLTPDTPLILPPE